MAAAFDSHHPPDPALVADCVHCGFCLPACPTYVLWGRETDSPRGRIALIKGALEHETDLTERVARHFDTCLGCMACVTACPSGVQYDKLLEATRPQIERRLDRPLADRIFRRLVFTLFPHPDRLRVAAVQLWVYQMLGLRRIARATGLLNLLPSRLQAMEAVLPNVSLRGVWTDMPIRVPASGTRRRRVGLLLGCVQRVFFNEVNAATVRVLAAEGCEVVIPPSQGCCGALTLHAGMEDDAAGMARRFIDAFEAEAADVDTIVINAAGSTRPDAGRRSRSTGTFCGTTRDMQTVRARWRTSVGTSPSCWPSWNRGRSGTRCRCGWPITTPVTCSMRRASTPNRGRC